VLGLGRRAPVNELGGATNVRLGDSRQQLGRQKVLGLFLSGELDDDAPRLADANL